MAGLKPIDRDRAETLALQALGFLAADPLRLKRFLQLTGLEVMDLAGAINASSFQASVLNHLLGDESLLLVFASETGTPPADIAPAHALLSGEEAAPG